MNEQPMQEPMPAEEPPARVPKACGADMELGNSIVGLSGQRGTCEEAARALLREIGMSSRDESLQADDGLWSSGGRAGASNLSDSGRKYLRSNGGCVYVDHGHLELCIPEVRSAYDHVACVHAMLRIARRALMDANAGMPPGRQIRVLANNSDGLGHSYGTHLNFLLSRRTWDHIFARRMHYMLFLAAYQVSSIVFTGQGKVGSENGRPPAPYQICARGDFFETLMGEQTTFRRPIVNARDEPLCGRSGLTGADHEHGEPMARLHCIFYDNTLCHVASLLKVGIMQIILAMIECEQVDADLVLDDPVAALVAWSHDPTLRTRARTASGRNLTAVEMQMLFFEAATQFVERGDCDGIVPRAQKILGIWSDTLEALKDAASTGNLAPLAPRLDWVLKLCILRRTMEQRPALTWDAPEIKHLDHLYSGVSADGLYWAYEKSGFVKRVVTETHVERFIHQPPEDTRAWTRAMLLRTAPPDAVAEVDWDHMRFKCSGRGLFRPEDRTLDLCNPLAFTRAESEPVFREADGLDDILDRLGAPRTGDCTILATPGLGVWPAPPAVGGAESCRPGRPDQGSR